MLIYCALAGMFGAMARRRVWPPVLLGMLSVVSPGVAGILAAIHLAVSATVFARDRRGLGVLFSGALSVGGWAVVSDGHVAGYPSFVMAVIIAPLLAASVATLVVNQLRMVRAQREQQNNADPVHTYG